MNSSAQTTALRTTWLTDPDQLRALAAEWQGLVDRVGADVYARPDWFSVWWDHFGPRRGFACLVARVSGVLVGVLPFVIDRIWAGPLPCRVARLAGIDPNCIIFQLALEPVWAAPVLQTALQHLLQNLGCLTVSFTPVSEKATHLPVLRDLAQMQPQIALREDGAGTHVIFDFTANFDDYLAKLTKKRVSQLRRNATGLKNLFAMTRNDSVADADAFDAFVDLHGDQWRAVNRGGHFSDWPGSASFYHDLAAQTAQAGLVQLDRLDGTGGALATELSLISGHTAHWRLPARRLNADVDRLCAGKVVFVLMFERMIAQGITRVEAGRGVYDYKIDYGGQTVPVHRVVLLPATRWARRRLQVLLAWADLVDFVYYRVWFLKLAPRWRLATGRKPQPLWLMWIRTRL